MFALHPEDSLHKEIIKSACGYIKIDAHLLFPQNMLYHMTSVV